MIPTLSKGCKSLLVSVVLLYFSTSDAQPVSINQSSATTGMKSLSYKLSLTTSYSTYSNWSSGHHNNFSFQGTGDCSYTIRKEKFKQQYAFRTSLNYVKYVDSLWIKATDYWKVSARITDQPGKNFTHSYSLLMSSQWLDSYRYVIRKGELIKEKRGSFMNPGSLTLAYGLNWNFWKRSTVNFSFASVKITTKPRYIPVFAKEEELARTRHAYIYSEYGMSIQADIDKKITSNVNWEHHSAFFSNGISRSRVQADVTNSFSLCFFRFMEFRIDTRIVYEPLYSYRLQFQHGFMIGFLLDVRNGKVNKVVSKE